MRSIVPFELDQSASTVDSTLDAFDWTIPNQPEQSPDFNWQLAVRQVPSRGALSAQEMALQQQHVAEHTLEALDFTTSDLDEVLTAQHAAIDAQEMAIRSEQALLARHPLPLDRDGQAPMNGDGHGPDNIQLSTFQLLAAKEARAILDQIARADRQYAYTTFRYPVFDRRTETWGTVHYEATKRHVVIRLRNSRSEKLKGATQRLVEHLILGDRKARRLSRLSALITLAKRVGARLWYQGKVTSAGPISFEQIKVLEPNSPNEAFTGSAVIERTLESVIRERRGELNVAAFFLALGLCTFFLSSPWFLDLDYRLHVTQHWHDGWLAWFAGNLTRLGSALFVGVFLPIIQVLLYWRAVRRKPSVIWNVD